MRLFNNILGIISIGISSGSSSCFRTKTGKCGEPLSQGDCNEGEWLVLGESGILECRDRDCHPEEVMIEGICRHVDDKSMCDGAGEAIFINARGEPHCQCKAGWGRNNRRQHASSRILGKHRNIVTIKSGGECFQEFTKGFCEGNFITKFQEKGLFGCINNPCGNSSLSLPHFTTWISFSEFTCHNIKSSQCNTCLPENLTDCEVEVDPEDNELRCVHEIGIVPLTVGATCLGKNCCGRNRFWSKYRKRCARIFTRF